MLAHTPEELLEIVKVLNERVWDNRLSEPAIKTWLSNFAGGEREQHLALHLLAHFMYFGQREVRELLRSMYRDLYRYRLLEEITGEQGDNFDADVIIKRLQDELAMTKFLGVGNPSESGTHLLYYFRQENQLSKELFIHTHQIFKRETQSGHRVLRDQSIRHYVFLDDLCGSGTQAKEYSEEIVADIKARDADARVYYFALFGMERGLSDVRGSTLFDQVDAVFVLDKSFRCFFDESRYFLPEEQEDRNEASEVMRRYGENLCPENGLGFKNGQLLIGFSHNIPDNTLPVIWCDHISDWAPIFPRYHKIY